MGRGALAGLAAAVLAVAATAAAAGGRAATTEALEFVPGEVIVRYEPGLGFSARQAVASAEQATVEANLRAPGAALVELSSGESVADAVEAFEQRPGVLSAQPNYVYHAALTPSDPLFGQLWGLDNVGQAVGSLTGSADADIDAPEAWELTTGSSAVRVAVADTGVDYDHPDLAGNIAAPGHDFYAGDADPRDENGHGTHVAGIIGALKNGIGVVGVSWQVGLLPVRVLGPTGSGTTATITNGFSYAVQHGAKVVNASLGGRTYDPLMESVIAGAPGTLFVVAAGNGGGDRIGDNNDITATYPCSYAAANLICVAATDASDSLAGFSNYGRTAVDLAAPGVGIGSTYPGGDYDYLQGTSMAAPHVAGVAALLLARNSAASVPELRGGLLDSVDVLGPLEEKLASGGRLNAHAALTALVSSPATQPPAAAPLPLTPKRPVKRVIKKTTVCFRKRTIKVRKSKLGWYKKRGAKLGACKKPRKRR